MSNPLASHGSVSAKLSSYFDLELMSFRLDRQIDFAPAHRIKRFPHQPFSQSRVRFRTLLSSLPLAAGPRQLFRQPIAKILCSDSPRLLHKHDVLGIKSSLFHNASKFTATFRRILAQAMFA